MEKALAFLKEHTNVALATVENDSPKIRVFQIMKQEGTVFYFATTRKRKSTVSYSRTGMWSF